MDAILSIRSNRSCRLIRDRNDFEVAQVVHEMVRKESLNRIRSAGFDATQGSQLHPIAAPLGFQQHHPALAASVGDTMIFLPLYPELTDFAVKQLSIAIVATGRVGFSSIRD